MKSMRSLGPMGYPVRVALPVGLLAAAVIFDLISLMGGNHPFALVAYWNLTLGLAVVLIAIVFGAWEWMSIPDHAHAKVLRMLHGAANLMVVGLFATSWVIRSYDPARTPTAAALALSFSAAALAVIGGWLGDEPTERHAVDVGDGGELDTPESLSGKHA